MISGSKSREIAVIIVVLTVSFLCAASVGGPEEFPITVNPGAQRLPRVYGDIVVWQDWRNGNWDIYGYNLSGQQEFPITTDSGDQENPAIYGDIVVWEERRDREYALCGYNLLTEELFEITTSPRGICNPAIYGDIVVWEGRGVGFPGILGYNLSTGEEFQITSDPNRQENPAIYDDIVVWEDVREDVIYGYNLSEGWEFQVSTGIQFSFLRYSQHDPAIYEDVVVWWEGWDSIICGHNLSTSKEFAISEVRSEKCPGSSSYIGPAIYKDIVVWVDCRNDDFDIYGFNLSTEEEFAVTESAGRQQSPAVYEDIVVWEDKRNGSWDIYGRYLRQPLATTSLNYQERRLLLTTLYGFLSVVPATMAWVLVRRVSKTITNLDEAPKETPFPEISSKDFMKKDVRSTSSISIVISSGLCSGYAIFLLLKRYYFFGVLCFGFAALATTEIWWNRISTAAFYVCVSAFAIFFLLNRYYFFGVLFLGFAALTITGIWWNRNIPYIHTTTDEIMIFPGIARRPKIVKWNSIERINQQEGKNTIRLYLQNDKEVDIKLSPMDDKDIEELFKILKHLPCPWTVSFHRYKQ